MCLIILQHNVVAHRSVVHIRDLCTCHTTECEQVCVLLGVLAAVLRKVVTLCVNIVLHVLLFMLFTNALKRMDTCHYTLTEHLQEPVFFVK